MLPPGVGILHTFTLMGRTHCGADITRERIEQEIDKGACATAGEFMTGMGHRLLVCTAEGPLWVETDVKKVLDITPPILKIPKRTPLRTRFLPG